MNIMITGGAGFIGTNFVRYLCSNTDHNITVLDKLTYAGKLDNLRGLGIRFVKGDIADKDDVEKAAEGTDAIINFAAESHVDRSIKDPSGFLRTNISGVFNLLEAARLHDTGKFIQISTDEVYGPIPEGSFSETDRLNPTNPYSASKAAGEHLCSSYFKTYGLPVTITRSSNNFGPYQYPEKLIPVIIVNALAGRTVPIYGTGRNVRDWIYVEDNCRGILTVLQKGVAGEVYNIGGGNERTNIEVAKLVLRMLGKPESLIRFVEERPGHDIRYSINSGKAHSLGWKPLRGFEEAMKATAEWYVSNRQWWQAEISMLPSFKI